MWRDLDTLDVTNDFSFKVDGASGAYTEEAMIIRRNRARLYINSDSSGFDHPATGPNDETAFATGTKALEIPIYQGAVSGLLTSAVVFFTTAAALTN